MAYNTVGRARILDYLKANPDRTVSANDISSSLQEEKIDLNISTIYRYLNKLSDEGVVNKYVSGKGEAIYQLISEDRNCKEHLHMQCKSCGRVIHLDCDFMDEFAEHIFKDHRFSIECAGSILYGTCEACTNIASV